MVKISYEISVMMIMQITSSKWIAESILLPYNEHIMSKFEESSRQMKSEIEEILCKFLTDLEKWQKLLS